MKKSTNHLNAIQTREMGPGFSGEWVHGKMATVAFFNIANRGFMTLQQYAQEQILHILEGELEMTIAGENSALK